MRGSTAGIDEVVLSPKMSYYSILLELLDTLYGSFIVAPLVVGYWRGTWNLLAYYLYPEDELFSNLVSLVIGVFGHMMFTIFQMSLTKGLTPDKCRLTYYFWSRVYSIVFGFVCVNGWRGGWQLIDMYTAPDSASVAFITLVSCLILAAIKSIRNITATPFVVIADDSKAYFDIPTYFKISRIWPRQLRILMLGIFGNPKLRRISNRKGTRNPGLYLLDCCFSVLIIGSLVVFVWRGLWVLLDLELFPHDHTLSAWASLIIGYGIVGITFGLQPIMKWACERLEGVWRVAAADLFLFLSFVGTVNVWRGVWHLLDDYFLPDNRVLSDWITHGISLIILILLNCSNSVLVRGVYIDAEEPAGQCVVFPVYYIRLFFQKERTKKQKRLKESLERQQEQNNTILLIEKQLNHNPSTIKNNKISNIDKTIGDYDKGDPPNEETIILCSKN